MITIPVFPHASRPILIEHANDWRGYANNPSASPGERVFAACMEDIYSGISALYTFGVDVSKMEFHWLNSQEKAREAFTEAREFAEDSADDTLKGTALAIALIRGAEAILLSRGYRLASRP